jgi:hypothetical protein
MAAEKIADLGDGLSIEVIDLHDLHEQDINARIMEPAMFAQLVANIKKRGQLESLPFCAVPAGKDHIEIVSGHHRARAASAAGLKRIPCIVDRSGLNRSQVIAKQLAHNAISGFDDQDTLKRLAAMITDVDLRLESWVAAEAKFPTSEQNREDIKLLAPRLDVEWKTVTLTFLPHQLDDFKALIDALEGTQDLVAAAPLDCFEAFVKALSGVSRIKDIRNAGTVIALLTRIALEQIQAEAERETS